MDNKVGLWERSFRTGLASSSEAVLNTLCKLAGFRWILFFFLASASLVTLVPRTEAADNDWIRPYLKFQLGKTLFSDPDSVPRAELESPSGEPSLGATIGVNIGRYFGFEIAADFVETELGSEGFVNKIGEYGMWTVIPQIRLRYPFQNDRLIPYVTIGAGLGSGEFNDRNFLNATLNPDQSASSAFDTAFIGAVGIGVEYFLRDSVAISIEARQTFGYETEIEVVGQPTDISVDSTTVGFGLRLFLDEFATEGPRGSAYAQPTPPRDSSKFRGYIGIHAGVGTFLETDSITEAQIADQTQPYFSGSIGVNFDKYFGTEMAISFFETELSSPQFGQIVEYTIVTFLGLGRLRYPMMNDRLSPYVTIGGGIGYSELNDRTLPLSEQLSVAGDPEIAPVAALGIGFDYFVSDNIAIGVDARYTFLFDQVIQVDQRPRTINLDTLSVSAGVRIFFP
jgi:opacity protein-like surface antigen